VNKPQLSHDEMVELARAVQAYWISHGETPWAKHDRIAQHQKWQRQREQEQAWDWYRFYLRTTKKPEQTNGQHADDSHTRTRAE
jgi:hypothetical protein